MKWKTFFKNNKHLLLLLLLPVYFIYFFFAEKLVPSDGEYFVVYSPLDDKIPFVESFVIFYYVWYAMLALAGIYPLLKGDKGAFVRYILIIYITFFGSVTFGLLFPNGQNLRPDLTALGRENVFIRLIAGLYEADTCTNVLPSMHVMGSFACVFAVMDAKGFPKWGVVVMAILAVGVSASTVLIKQHSIVDVYAGLAVIAVVGAAMYAKRIAGYLQAKKANKNAANSAGDCPSATNE